MEMKQMQHHHLQQSSSVSDYSAVDFDSVFAGVSLQSLLLGEPVLVTPPLPPFPSLPAPQTTTITFAQPHQQYDKQIVHPHHCLLHPPTFFFQADAADFGEKQTPQPARRSLPQCSFSTRSSPAPPRRQRQKVSEKLKALRRIVPCDQKADIATMLEQAYRYVRFLEAQVLALLTMQFRTLNDGHEGRGLGFDGDTSEMEERMIEIVGRLSRLEVLEAVVNSGTAQKVMYEEGLCLVSEEQVRVWGWATFLKQQQLLGLIGNDLGNNSNTCYSYSYSCSN